MTHSHRACRGDRIRDVPSNHSSLAGLSAMLDDYRSVFMLREIEGLSTAETAECLEISEENVKTRGFERKTVSESD